MFDKSKYKCKRLFKDEHFKDGFRVYPPTYNLNRKQKSMVWSFPESEDKPKWWLKTHYSLHCLIKDRQKTDNPYELTDKHHSKRVVYNPEENSLLLQLDARNIFEGKNKLEHFWPHLLIEQRKICDYKNMPEGEEKRFYSTNCDKICVEYDIRLLEYIPTTNPGDLDVCQFVAYVYLNVLGSKRFIYIGVTPFDSRGMHPFFWECETGGDNFVYFLDTETVFGGKEKTFMPNDEVVTGEEWKHIEVDITPYIDQILEKANKDLAFGRIVTRDEVYFGGNNMGYEVHSNCSCTIEIKNFNIVTYIKK